MCLRPLMFHSVFLILISLYGRGFGLFSKRVSPGETSTAGQARKRASGLRPGRHWKVRSSSRSIIDEISAVAQRPQGNANSRLALSRFFATAVPAVQSFISPSSPRPLFALFQPEPRTLVHCTPEPAHQSLLGRVAPERQSIEACPCRRVSPIVWSPLIPEAEQADSERRRPGRGKAIASRNEGEELSLVSP